MIVLVLGAAVSLEIQYSQSAKLNKHKLQAINLASEALNLTRVIRDNNLLAGQSAFPSGTALDGTVCTTVASSCGLKLKSGSWDLSKANSPEIITLDGTQYTINITVEK